MLRRMRIGLGLLVLAASLLFFIWGTWPVHRELRVRPVSDQAGSALQEQRVLTLLFPPRLRAGDPGVVRVTLQADHTGTATPPAHGNAAANSASDFYSTHSVIAEARFDLPGIPLRPSELISAPISPGQTAVFYWTLHPNEAGRYPGTIWLYLRTVDKSTGQESRETLSAQVVQIESVKLLGFPANRVRILALVGIVIGLALSMPFFRGLLLRRGKKPG